MAPPAEGRLVQFGCVFTVFALFATTRYMFEDAPHHDTIAFLRYHYFGGGCLKDAPIRDPGTSYPQIDLRRMPKQAVVFLYNSTLPDQVEFLHDVRVANWKHSMEIYKLDCVKFRTPCAERGHGQIHEYEEPPLIFYHHRQWSESYHDDIQTNVTVKPSTRRERVRAVIDWINSASERAQQKLNEREEMLYKMEAMGSPTQRMMREMQEKNAKEEAATKAKKEL